MIGKHVKYSIENIVNHIVITMYGAGDCWN